MQFSYNSKKPQKLSVEICDPVIIELFQQYPYRANFNKVAQNLMLIGAGFIKRQKIQKKDVGWKLNEFAEGVKKEFNEDLIQNLYNEKKHHKKNNYDHAMEYKRGYSNNSDKKVNDLQYEVQSIKKTLAKISQNLNQQHHSSQRIRSPQKQNLYQSPNSRHKQLLSYEPTNKDILEDQQILQQLEQQKEYELDRLQNLKRNEDLEKQRIKTLNTEIKYEKEKLRDDIQHENNYRTQPVYSNSNNRRSPNRFQRGNRHDITPKVGEYQQRSNSARMRNHF